jgi:hypothetical protein
MNWFSRAFPLCSQTLSIQLLSYKRRWQTLTRNGIMWFCTQQSIWLHASNLAKLTLTPYIRPTSIYHWWHIKVYRRSIWLNYATASINSRLEPTMLICLYNWKFIECKQVASISWAHLYSSPAVFVTNISDQEYLFLCDFDRTGETVDEWNLPEVKFTTTMYM